MEGALYMCIKYFLNTIEKLLHDKVENVPIRAKSTLNHIIKFAQNLEDECNEAWVSEIIATVNDEEIATLETKIKSKLRAVYSFITLDDVELKFSLQECIEDGALESQVQNEENMEKDKVETQDDTTKENLDAIPAENSTGTTETELLV